MMPVKQKISLLLLPLLTNTGYAQKNLPRLLLDDLFRRNELAMQLRLEEQRLAADTE